MYRITFNTEFLSDAGDSPNVLAERYRILPGGVLELTLAESTHPRNVQLLAPHIWQNAVIEFVEEWEVNREGREERRG